MRNQQRAVQREFELNNRNLVQTGRDLTTVGSIVQRVISVYNTWQLLQIRTALTAKNLRDAQKDLQDTFLEFGGTSREYQEALERVNEAEKEAVQPEPQEESPCEVEVKGHKRKRGKRKPIPERTPNRRNLFRRFLSAHRDAEIVVKRRDRLRVDKI